MDTATPSRRALLGATSGIVAAALGAASGCGPARGRDRRQSTETPAAPATLEVWLPGRQADAEALAPFHAQFVAETPGVSEVNVRLVTNEDMMDRLTAALIAGTPPDVARLKEYRMADLGARNSLLALDRMVAKDPAVRLADFTPQSVEGSRYTPPRASGEGRLIGLPDSHQLVVLYWNKGLLAIAGREPGRAPPNWEDLRQTAQAVAVAPSAGEARRWGFQFYEFSPREQTYSWFMEWVWRAGGDVWGRDGRDRTRATLDTPAALRALQFQVDLLLADRTAVPPGTPVPELIANVAQGRVGLWMTTANAALTYERTAPGLRFGIGPLPPDRRDAHQLQHNALSVFKESRLAELAYRLVSFRSREDVQLRWSAEGAWLPVRPALWVRPPYNQDWRWRTIGELVHRPGNRPKPVVPQWDAFTGAVLPHLLAAWRGEVAPRQALAMAEQAANAQLRAGTPHPAAA